MSKRQLHTNPTKKRNITAKQRANLIPAKKGEVRNPNGGRTHNPALKAFRNFTQDAFREVLEIVMRAPGHELQALIDDPNTPSLHMLIAVSFQDAIKNKSFGLVERIADRIIGKLPENHNITSTTDANVKVGIFDGDMLRSALNKLKDYV